MRGKNVFSKIEPQISNLDSALNTRDFFLYALFARVALKNNVNIEFETKFDESTNTIELIINPRYLELFDQLIGIERGPNFKKYIDWLIGSESLSGAPVSFGVSTQIPYMNADGDDFLYSSNLTFDGDDLRLNSDTKIFFGEESNSSIYYDDTNLIVNPKEAGSGILDVLGVVQSDGYNSSDGTAGASATTGGLTFKDGLYVSGTVSESDNIFIDWLATVNPDNWDAAYSWGDHASAGYITSVAFSDLTDYPVNIAGVLTNDGDGVLSWSAIPDGCSFGATTQIPYMNAGGTDFLYSDNFTFNGSKLTINGDIVADGFRYLDADTDGTSNVFISTSAGYSNVSGNYNIAMGKEALYYNQTGTDNVCVGFSAGKGVAGTNPTYNTFIGSYCGTSIQSGGYNVGIGAYALWKLTTGTNNFCLGYTSGTYLTTGSNNVCIGNQAGLGDSGKNYSNCVYIGSNAGKASTTANGNTGIGTNIFQNITSGIGNVGVGTGVGQTLETGGSNILIGVNVDSSSSSINHELNIGSLLRGIMSGTRYLWMPNDNDKFHFGAGMDASIYYDAINLIIDPKEVGTGILDVLGTLQTDGYNAADGTAGASATTGGLTFKNGLYTAGTISILFSDLTDYPEDAAGVLTNDGSGNLSWGGGGTPGGSTTQMQYNNAGAFAGTTGLAWIAGSSCLKWNDNIYATFGTGSDTKLYTNSSNHFYIENDTPNADIFIRVNDGGTDVDMVQFDASLSRTIFGFPADITESFRINGSSTPYSGTSTTTGLNVLRYTDTSASPCNLQGLLFDVRNQRQINSEEEWGDLELSNYGIRASFLRSGGMAGIEESYSEANWGAKFDMTVGGTCSISVGGSANVISYGVENLLLQNYVASGVPMNTTDYGGKFTVNLSQTTPEASGGAMYSTVYGFYTDVLISANRTAGSCDAYGAYILTNAASGVNVYGLYVTGQGSAQTIKNYLGEDNVKTFFGAGLDASVYYDGTNFVINPKEVGTGYLSVLGNIVQADSVAHIFGTGLDASIDYDGVKGNIRTDLVAPSDLNIDCGTDKTIVLEETVWEDLRITPGSFDRPGASDPTIQSVQPGGSGTATWLYRFEKDNIASFTIQLPHNYKIGTSIYCHVHWTPGERGNEENTATVGWKLDYAWASINEIFGTMATIDLSDACDGVDWKHQMTPDIEIAGVDKGISSMLICNIKRTDTGTDDTWAGTGTSSPFLLEIDFHYEIDTMGSRQIGAK